MGAPILQLGFLIDFPPLLGPLFVGAGFTILMLWYLQTHYLSVIADDLFTNRALRARVVAPLVLGVIIIAFGIAVRGTVVWAFIGVLFIVSRAIEGGVTIRTYRRIMYYLTRVLTALNPKSTKSHSESDSLASAIFLRISYKLVSLTVILIAITLTSVGVIVTAPPLRYSLSFVWASVVSTTTVFVFLWDLRGTIHQMDPVPIVGILFCIVGAETYNFTNKAAPSWLRQMLFDALPSQVSGYPSEEGFTLLFILYVAGWIAYIFGVGFSIALLVTKSRST